MQSPFLIGIYTRPTDDHLPRVLEALKRRRLSALCFDRADFPRSLHLAAHFETGQSGWQGDIIFQGQHYRLEQFRSIWYRRPGRTYTFVPGLSSEGYAFANAEARRGFEGVLYSVPCLWVSDPDALRTAEWKPRQLVYAQQVGLRIPRTLITTDQQAALQFFDACQGEVVYKPFSQGILSPKVGDIWQGAIYTTKLTRSALEEHLASVSITATCLQEYIAKAFELRVTVIGSRLFAAEIHSQHSERARVDFRLGYGELKYALHTLPPVIEQACKALVRLFNLQFAALDLLVTPDGEYVFVDLNSNGQWGWIEQQTGLPLTETLVSLLARGKEEEKR